MGGGSSHKEHHRTERSLSGYEATVVGVWLQCPLPLVCTVSRGAPTKMRLSAIGRSTAGESGFGCLQQGLPTLGDSPVLHLTELISGFQTVNRQPQPCVIRDGSGNCEPAGPTQMKMSLISVAPPLGRPQERIPRDIARVTSSMTSTRFDHRPHTPATKSPFGFG